jgi:two-component system KDP operon response regulator KdpE
MSQEPKPLVLIVDDEPQMRRLLAVSLEASDYRVEVAASGQEGLVLAAQRQPALIVLDIGLPDLSGEEVLRRLREWTNVPVIVLSVLGDAKGKVAAFDAGADDYVTKPFNTDELLARMRVVLRRAVREQPVAVFQARELVVDLATRLVSLHGKELKLSVTEYNLLRLFVRNAGMVLTHRHILREIWGPGHDQHTHYLRVYIGHLREKIEADPAHPKFITTELGVGYRFRVPE